MKPTIGRTVLFVLTSALAEAINQKRVAWRNAETHPCSELPHPGSQMHQGNHCYEGEIYPAVIVKVWEAEQPSVNLQVFLDGSDSLWATSVYESSDLIPGTWHWPIREELNREIPSSGTVGEVGNKKPILSGERSFIPGDHNPNGERSGAYGIHIDGTETHGNPGEPDSSKHEAEVRGFPTPGGSPPPVADASGASVGTETAESASTVDNH